MTAGSCWNRCLLVVSFGMLMTPLPDAAAQNVMEKKDPDRMYSMEYTINYQTSQGPYSISQCATANSVTLACQCAQSMAELGLPLGATVASTTCQAPAPMSFCQTCPDVWPPPPPFRRTANPCGVPYWVVRISGITRKDGCVDCDRRRDRVTAVGLGNSYCEAEANARRALCATAQKYCRGGIRKWCRPEIVYRPTCAVCP